jgi:hypothetical protein
MQDFMQLPKELNGLIKNMKNEIIHFMDLIINIPLVIDFR